MNMEKCRWEESCGHEYCNLTDCPEYEAQPMTNAYRIRAMTDEELCEAICHHVICANCPAFEYCREVEPTRAKYVGCKNVLLEFLHQPWKGDAE